MKKMKLYLLICASIFLMTSCMTAAPTPVAQSKKDKIMAMAEKYRFKSLKRVRSSKSQKMRIKKGQWTAELTTMKTGLLDLTLKITKVIDVTGSRVTLETESYSADNNAVMTVNQTVIENYPLNGKLVFTKQEAENVMGNIRMVSSKTRTGDGEVVVMPEGLLMISQQLGKSFVQNNVSAGEIKTAPAKTPYLKSSKCYIYDSVISVLGFKKRSTITGNSYIPFSGMVKMENEDMIVETIGYGYKGAKAVL